MKVTVITVNLNGNRYLREAIDSVLMQKSAELEYLIIDGGSTDGSLETIAVAAHDSRVRWISESDRGISHAMNKGAALATGELIAILHSDDCYHRNDILSTVIGIVTNHPETIWCTGGMREVGPNGHLIREVKVRRYSRRRLIRNNIILHPSTFVRRSALLDAGGFDESLRYAMDYDLWLKLSAHSDPFLINREMSSFRVHQGSLSIKNRLDALDEEFLVRRRYLKGAFTTFAHACYHALRRVYEVCHPARV